MPDSMAQRIKKLRNQRQMTLEQVGAIVGVGKSTVRKWETGMISNIKGDKIALLAKALGTTPEYLMGWDIKSQIDNLAIEIEQLRSEISSAPPEEIGDLEYALALKEESYEDFLFSQQMGILSQIKISPHKPELTEEEKVMLELFRQIPAEQQPMVLAMIRAALGTDK